MQGGLEEFRGLEGGESIDQDFSDLDNMNLEDIDLDVDMEEETPPATGGAHHHLRKALHKDGQRQTGSLLMLQKMRICQETRSPPRMTCPPLQEELPAVMQTC